MLIDKIKLESDERILRQVRKHWFVIGMQLFSVGIVAVFPLLAYAGLTAFPAFSELTATIPLTGEISVGLYTVWLIITWMVAFSIWTNYYLDVWTITNKRVISVDQRGLFHRHTSSFMLERLQDMSVEFHGIIETFLDFGSLEAQTAGGEQDKFRATGLPRPRELKSLILSASDRALEQHGVASSDGL